MNLPVQSQEDAVEQAARRLGTVLLTPDNLNRVDAIRQQLSRKKESIDIQLRTAVQSQLEDARLGMDLLHKSFGTIDGIQHSFDHIDQMCVECQTLIEDYPFIRSINLLRQNLRRTLTELDKVNSIPSKITQMRKMLEDDRHLLTVHREIRQLEARRQAVLQVSQDDPEVLQMLQSMFDQVYGLSRDLDKKLWTTIRNALAIAQHAPATLVKVLQIIELETEAGRTVTARGTINDDDDDTGPDGPDGPAPPARTYLDECRATLTESIAENYQLRTTREGAASSTSTDQILGAVQFIVDNLNGVIDCVVPCFPPEYKVFDLFAKEYHRLITEEIQPFLEPGAKILTGDILNLVRCTYEYEAELSALGVVDLTPRLATMVECLIPAYCSQIRELMTRWCGNILAVDEDAAPITADGLLCTHAPVDLFKMVNQQLEVVEPLCWYQLNVVAVQECEWALTHFQGMLMARLQQQATKPMTLEYIAAVINNNSRCYDLVAELQDKANEMLENSKPDDIQLEPCDFDTVAHGFHNVAKTAVSNMAALLFQELGPTFEFFFSKDWVQEEPMETVIATLDDYLGEISTIIMDFFFKKLANECLHRVTRGILDSAIHHHSKFAVDDDTAELLSNDQKKLALFFSRFIREKSVNNALKVVEAMSEFLDAEPDPGMISLHFESIHAAHPQIAYPVAESLLSMRKDLERKEIKEVLAACQQIAKGSKTDDDRSGEPIAVPPMAATPGPASAPASAQGSMRDSASRQSGVFGPNIRDKLQQKLRTMREKRDQTG